MSKNSKEAFLYLLPAAVLFIVFFLLASAAEYIFELLLLEYGKSEYDFCRTGKLHPHFGFC